MSSEPFERFHWHSLKWSSQWVKVKRPWRQVQSSGGIWLSFRLLCGFIIVNCCLPGSALTTVPFLYLVDGVWGSWSKFSSCSKSCGNGTSTRNRSCEYSPTAPRGKPCPGDATEINFCNTIACISKIRFCQMFLCSTLFYEHGRQKWLSWTCKPNV